MSIDRIQTYQELHEKYIMALEEFSGEFHLPNDKILADFETWVEHQPGGNKAFVLLDVETGEYAKWHLIKEKFGYNNEEFTAAAVNNFANPMLVHPEHIEHKRRYSDIIIELLKSEPQFKVRMDSYSVEFKLFHKDKYYVPVRRTSIIFQIEDETTILSRLDEYEILSKHHADYVYPEISMTELQKTNELNEKFYKKNLEALKIGNLFSLNNTTNSSELIQIFYYKLQHPNLSNKEIASKLSLKDEHVVEKLFNRISERIRFRFGDYNLQGVQKIKTIARKYGLFPLPKNLVE